MPEKVLRTTLRVPPRLATPAPEPVVSELSSGAELFAIVMLRSVRRASFLTTSTRTLLSPLTTIFAVSPPKMVSPDASVMAGSVLFRAMVAPSPGKS